MEHLINSQQLTKPEIDRLFSLADRFRGNHAAQYSKVLERKLLASLFYEPSTRTRLSFEAAMKRLGGEVIGTENAKIFSSVAKGETLSDTIRIIGSYVDAIVLRHDEIGSADIASSVSSIPIINAGDGAGQHPTQALLDLYTLYREFDSLDNLTVAFVGDLKNGRTVRSLLYLLAKHTSASFVLISPENLQLEQDIIDYLHKKNCSFSEETDLNKVLSEVDVVYMTRIQKERMSEYDYQQAKGKYSITEDNFSLLRNDARLLHPLPKVDEIQLPIELEQQDERVTYFRQAENGLYIRMAILYNLMLDN